MPCTKDADCPNVQTCTNGNLCGKRLFKLNFRNICINNAYHGVNKKTCSIIYSDCVDDPNGYDGYGCQGYQYYCVVEDYTSVWHEKFRAACRRTCSTCTGLQCKIHFCFIRCSYYFETVYRYSLHILRAVF